MSSTDAIENKSGIEGTVPILRVKDLPGSIDFYVEVLGFKVDWGGESGAMASVSRGRGSLMLCQDDQGNPGTWVWIGVQDAEAFHREYSAAGARIALPPTNYPWALEFHVQDPDGHVLRFGSEPKADRPLVPWIPWYRNRA